jgi:hypothetical protein
MDPSPPNNKVVPNTRTTFVFFDVPNPVVGDGIIPKLGGESMTKLQPTVDTVADGEK